MADPRPGMTDADRRAFAVEMALLAEVFGEQISETRIAAYFTALEDRALGEVQRAMRTAIRTSRYFPRPVELIEIIRAERAMARALPGPERKALPAGQNWTMPQALRDLLQRFTWAPATARGPARSVDTTEAEVAQLRRLDAADPDLRRRRDEALAVARAQGFLP